MDLHCFRCARKISGLQEFPMIQLAMQCDSEASFAITHFMVRVNSCRSSMPTAWYSG